MISSRSPPLRPAPSPHSCICRRHPRLCLHHPSLTVAPAYSAALPAQFYVDGSLIKQGDAFDLTATDVLAWNIGVRNLAGYSGVHFKGYIDEVRLSKVARYTGSFTPENKAFTN